MGVTIHYEGRLRDAQAFDELAARVKEMADAHEWLFSAILARKVHLPRVVEGKLVEYVGPAKGVVVNPHENCEAVRFIFDSDGVVEGSVKTQFCPSGIHVRIVEMLRAINDLFEDLRVSDDGAYWETSDRDLLEQKKKSLAGEIESRAEFLNQPRAQRPRGAGDGE